VAMLKRSIISKGAAMLKRSIVCNFVTHHLDL
jgi:hypothetical protein